MQASPRPSKNIAVWFNLRLHLSIYNHVLSMDEQGVKMSISCDLATRRAAADQSTKLVMQMVCALDAETLISSLLMQADTQVANGAPCGGTHKETSSAQGITKKPCCWHLAKGSTSFTFKDSDEASSLLFTVPIQVELDDLLQYIVQQTGGSPPRPPGSFVQGGGGSQALAESPGGSQAFLQSQAVGPDFSQLGSHRSEYDFGAGTESACAARQTDDGQAGEAASGDVRKQYSPLVQKVVNKRLSREEAKKTPSLKAKHRQAHRSM